MQCVFPGTLARQSPDFLELLESFKSGARRGFATEVESCCGIRGRFAEERPIFRPGREEFQGRTGATRRRPWAARVASAWLIQRFIDGGARFPWLDRERQMSKDKSAAADLSFHACGLLCRCGRRWLSRRSISLCARFGAGCFRVCVLLGCRFCMLGRLLFMFCLGCLCGRFGRR
jgi:hypothetical protein